MALLQIIPSTAPSEENAFDRVRALVLPLLPANATPKAAVLLPDSLIAGPGVGVMAERMVIRRIGPDWTLINAGAAPAIYADGDSAMAQLLLLEGVLLWCCYFLVPQARLLVPMIEKSEIVSRQLDLNWTEMRQGFAAQANATLELLKPLTAAPALSMATAQPVITDPRADGTVLVMPASPASPARSVW